MDKSFNNSPVDLDNNMNDIDEKQLDNLSSVTNTNSNDKTVDNSSETKQILDNNQVDYEKELLHIKKQAEEYKDKYIRLLAEMDNLKKRHEKEKLLMNEYALEKFLLDLLPLIDAFDLAIQNCTVDQVSDNSTTSFLEGIKLVKKQLDDIVIKHGLRVIESTNKKFDPNLHHAIQKIESTDVTEYTVKEEFSKGYLLKDKLLRPAIVSVYVPSVSSNVTDKQTSHNKDDIK